MVALLVLWLVFREARQARAAWLAYQAPDRVPLGLPGTGPLRLTEARVAAYRWLVTNLRAHADRTLSTVGSPSLHAWSGVDPPSRLVIPNSLRVLDEAQARALLEAIDHYPRFVLLRRQRSFLSPRLDDTPGSLPILDALDERFVTVASRDGWELQIRRQRPPITVLDGPLPISPRRYLLRLAPRPRVPLASITVRDAETGRELGRPVVHDAATGGEPGFDPETVRAWTIELDPAAAQALATAAAAVLRVEGPGGRWLASFPFLEDGRSAGAGPKTGEPHRPGL
jgi:hypothetical protein